MRIGCVGAVAGLAMAATPGDTNRADAAKFVIVPIGFPIADCGTVGLVDSTFPFPGSDAPDNGCLAWFPDNSPGAYLVGGLDQFQVGDRVFVEGLVCNICLTTCAAGAILDSTITPCENDEPKMDALVIPAKR